MPAEKLLIFHSLLIKNYCDVLFDKPVLETKERYERTRNEPGVGKKGSKGRNIISKSIITRERTSSAAAARPGTTVRTQKTCN